MPDTRAGGSAGWLLALGLGLAALLLLQWAFPVSPVNGDVSRDWLLARDCVDLDQCHTYGANSSVPGTSFGAIWLDVIETVRLLGLDADGVRRAVLALNALAIGVVAFVTWRQVKPALALPSALVTAAYLLTPGVLTPFRNPSIVLLPSALTAAFTALFAVDGRTRYLAAAAFSLGVALNTHTSAAALVPGVLFLAAAGSSRLRRDVLTGGGVLVATCLSSSWQTWQDAYGQLRSHGFLLPALVGVAALLISGRVLATRFQRLPRGGRLFAAGAALTLPFLIGAAALELVLHHGIARHYPIAVLAPVSVLLSAGLDGVLRRAAPALLQLVPLVTSLVAVGVLGFGIQAATSNRSGGLGGWTLVDADAIARAVLGRGWTYERALLQVEGSQCQDLTAALGLSLPAPDHKPIDETRALRWRLSARTPAGADIAVPLQEGGFAVLDEIPSWLRPRESTVCYTPVGGGGKAQCQQLALGGGPFLFSYRSFGSYVHSLDMEPPYLAQYEIPMIPASSGPRTIAVLTEAGQEKCGWRFVSVTGLKSDDALPASRITLRAGSAAEGKLVIARAFGTRECPEPRSDSHFPPCFFETDPGESGVAAAGGP